MTRPVFALDGELSQAMADESARRVLFERSTSSDPAVRDAAAAVIQRVRNSGDAALRELARQFDGVDLTSLEVPLARCNAALGEIDSSLRQAMERAARNIERAHAAFLPEESVVETEPGVVITRRPDPLRRVGVYAPGGRASYPSSVLMGAIPARVAGVDEVILCSPPGANGLPATPVLAAAALAGVNRVFAVGGAGAIAAMALGTESIPRADRIVGPGNAWVAEAKLQLSGFVSFDSPAGPSELLVLADDSSDPEAIVRELLAQAEHDPLASVVAVCSDRSVCAGIRAAVLQQVADSPRREVIEQALGSRGALLYSLPGDAMLQFAERFAPEHLLLVTRDAQELAVRVRNAGTVFVGQSSSVAYGDYMTGANHVLPTGTLARSYSGLSTLDFIRWTTIQRVSPNAARALASDVAAFAMAEELPAHAAAARAWGERPQERRDV